MAAYFIADVEIVDREAYDTYRQGVPAVLQKYGGRFLARGGTAESMEGGWEPKRVVILEFDDMDALKRWYHSDDYADLLAQRLAASNSRAITVEGV